MRSHCSRIIVAVGFVAMFVACAHAQTYTNLYVWQGGGHVWPYTNWATAANDIQTAIDAGEDGAIVWVANGVYDTGGRPAPGQAITNRVVINKTITVRSVNGPSNTVIEGFKNVSVNAQAVRGVYMTNNSVLIGFSVINARGSSSSPENTSGGIWAVGPNNGQGNTIIDCVVTNCQGWQGGGVRGGTLYNCVLMGNNGANGGGGAILSVLHDCIISRNGGDGSAGVSACTLYNCILEYNSCGFYQGGGARLSTLYNCLLIGNRARSQGGGANESVLYNCALINNVSRERTTLGGGAYNSTLYNCVVAGNTSELDADTNNGLGGGVFGGTNFNSIVFHNFAGNPAASNYWGISNFTFSCAAPLPAGNGNMDSDPLFRDINNNDCSLARGSPCINAGTNYAYMTDPSVLATNKWLGLDLDGGPRINFPIDTVDMGAYEYMPRGTIFMIRGAQ